LEFSNIKQLEFYLIEKLGLAIDRNGDLSHDDGASSRFWQSNLLLRYIKVQQIRGIKIPCNYTERPGIHDIYGNQTCIREFMGIDENIDKTPF
jgi:hypothetical protein